MNSRLAQTEATQHAAGERGAGLLSPRQYEFLFDLTTRMLAAGTLDEQLALAAEAITAGLGFPQAAFATLNESRSSLRLRVAAGFECDASDGDVKIDGGQLASVVLEGRTAWCSRGDGDAGVRTLLERLGCAEEILALPLCGGNLPPDDQESHAEEDGPEEVAQVSAPESTVECLGVLCVRAARGSVDEGRMGLLRSFATRVGVAISHTLEFERLRSKARELDRERRWVESVMKSVADPIAVYGADGELVLFNTRAEKLFREEAGKAAEVARENAARLAGFLSTHESRDGGGQAELELRDPQTGDTLPMEVTSAEVTDAGGEVTAIVSILHDLSAVRELERRRVEQQLFESEKLAAVGRLAASIAHEVNNPLEAIKNSLYLLTTNRDAEANERFLEVARKETERVSHIIRQMLGFARRSGDVERAGLNQLLEETLILIEKKLRQARVRVERDFDPELPAVRARADQLRQVFLNLLLNAQQAIDKDGTITVRTMRQRHALQPTVAVEISDTGRGMVGAELARIFEPFFSTRDKGTGLGLWVTHDIVRHHGGRIEVTSAEGAGTTFRVIIPVSSPTLAEENEGSTD